MNMHVDLSTGPHALITLLHRCQQRFDREFEAANKSGITRAQFLILNAIDQSESAPLQRDLIAAAAMDRSTLSTAVDHLEHLKLVRRRRAAHDRRAWNVELTAEGVAALHQARRAAAHAGSALLGSLSTTMRGTVAVSILRQMAAGESAPKRPLLRTRRKVTIIETNGGST